MTKTVRKSLMGGWPMSKNRLRTGFWSLTRTARKQPFGLRQPVGQQRTAKKKKTGKARKKLGSIGANHAMVETVKFDLGQLLITPGALDALTRNSTDEGPYLLRHQSGDWGDLSEIDKRVNDFSLLERFRLMSAYHLNDQTKIWGHYRARP